MPLRFVHSFIFSSNINLAPRFIILVPPLLCVCLFSSFRTIIGAEAVAEDREREREGGVRLLVGNSRGDRTDRQTPRLTD
jgi:hypothetical protein